MRHLEVANQNVTTAITFVPMRGKYDCLTCATAMLLGIKYEEVEAAFGGNIDPTKDKQEEGQRLYNAFERLLLKLQRGALNHLDMPPLREGRRYWITVRIDDPTNPLSKDMSHGIVVDEAGKVFDPNPQYGEFKSLAEWQAAMSLRHRLESATEIFEYVF
ncbi:MAG: hypothetical protein ABSB66_15560 [Candidatus Acidiferrales bacterium]|jgi:hypothetical protein